MSTLQYYFSILILLLINSSCQKKEVETSLEDEECIHFEMLVHSSNDSVPVWSPGNQNQGKLSGYKQNKEWKASGFITDHRDDTAMMNLTFTTYYHGDHLKEVLSIRNIPKISGCYEVKSNPEMEKEIAQGNYYTLDFDVYEDRYMVYSEGELVNKISIDRISNDSIIGRLALTFSKDKSTNYTTISPDYIRFYNASFSIKRP